MTIRGSGSTSCQSWRRSTRGDPRHHLPRRGHPRAPSPVPVLLNSEEVVMGQEKGIDRRTFLTAVGGAVAVANFIVSEGCSSGDNASAAGLHRIEFGAIEPGAFMSKAN